MRTPERDFGSGLFRTQCHGRVNAGRGRRASHFHHLQHATGESRGIVIAGELGENAFERRLVRQLPQMVERIPATTRPLRRMTTFNPMIIFTVVLLPAPLGPT